jgi:phosphomannomutase/phosphoglucomutase
MLAVAATAAGLVGAERHRIEVSGRQAMAAAADAAAFNVRDRLGWSFRALSGMGSDLRLAEALAAGDPKRIADEERRLTGSLPGSLLVRLVPNDSDLLDASRAPAMGYADLEAVREARRGESLPAMHAANSPNVHVALAVPLAEGRGVLLASLSPDILLDAMRSVPMPFGAALELRQGELPLGFTGDRARRAEPPEGEASVLGSRGWRIVYWRPAEDQSPLWWAFAAGGAALLLILAALVWAGHVLAKAMKHDAALVLALVPAARSGVPRSAGRARLREMQDLLDGLRALGALAPEEVPLPRPALIDDPNRSCRELHPGTWKRHSRHERFPSPLPLYVLP